MVKRPRMAPLVRGEGRLALVRVDPRKVKRDGRFGGTWLEMKMAQGREEGRSGG